jgi:hypothetical protein
MVKFCGAAPTWAAHVTTSRPLKNYLRWQYGVKNGLGMLIYSQ